MISGNVAIKLNKSPSLIKVGTQFINTAMIVKMRQEIPSELYIYMLGDIMIMLHDTEVDAFLLAASEEIRNADEALARHEMLFG